MKILIFGGTGMLGHKLYQVLGEHFDVFATIRRNYDDAERYGIFAKDRIVEHVDVTEHDSIRRVLDAVRPNVVINAVGVIKQLPSSTDVISTLIVNSIFPQQLAMFASEYGFRLICISTDCVFDGEKGNYTESDTPNALDLYGQSKHWGEVSGKNCLTLRTSIIGRDLGTSHSLADWFLSNRNGKVKGFRNAIYSGFPTVVFADIIRDLIAKYPEMAGLYHVSSVAINKFDLLTLLNSAYKANVKIEPFDDLKIDRSLNSDQFREATGYVPPDWPTMIELMAADATPYDTWKTQNH